MLRNKFVYSCLVMGAALLFSCVPAQAHIISAASCSQSDVQNAINSAANGDRVVVPGGSCTWPSGVAITSAKYVTLDGGGATTISGTLTFTACPLVIGATVQE